MSCERAYLTVPCSIFRSCIHFFEATCALRKMWRPKSLPVSIHLNAVSLKLIYWGLLSMKNPLSSKLLQLYIISITHIIPPEQTRDKKTDWESLWVKIEVYFKRSFSIASCILLSIYTSKLLKNYNLNAGLMLQCSRLEISRRFNSQYFWPQYDTLLTICNFICKWVHENS